MRAVRSAVMEILQPWHVLVMLACLGVVAAVVVGLVLLIRALTRKG